MKAMKRIVLMVILLSAALAGRAQGDYIPLNVDGMVWTMWNKLSVPTGDGRVSYERYKAEGDTIIDGSKFERILGSYIDDVTNQQQWGSTSYFIRDDNGKIYLCKTTAGGKNEKELVMDFTLKVGDVLPVYGYQVIAVSDTILNGSSDRQTRRCLLVKIPGDDVWDGYGYVLSDVWIEGIGSLKYGFKGAFGRAELGSFTRLEKCEMGTVRQQAVESSMATTKLRIIPVEGEIVEERLFVQDNDFVSLKLSDVNDEPVEVSKDTQTRWQLVIPKGRDRYWECDLGGDSQGCSFRMSPYFVGGRADMLECVWDDETDNVYNDGVIRATMKKGDQVVGNAEFPIRLNVLPSMPQVALISSGEEYDDEYGRFIPIYYLRISAKGYITGYVFSNGNMGQVFFADEPMPMTLRIDWAYPNCFFSCSLHNDYGWTKSPPFFAEFTGIDQHEYGQFSIKQHNGICLIDLGHTMDHALIADLNGKTWCSLHNVNHIELPLPTGVYLLRLKDGKSNNTIKIVIK